MDKRNYLGIVLENKDPKRIGRCKIRVISVFDTLPTEDIPWATPWKDPNGNQFIVPEIGKVVTVQFDSDNIYKPEYIYSESYNINLERKLENIDESDYITMRALMFDHKTQIYSNDSEGLVFDYKYNKINLKEDSLNLELKDNFSKVNIGSKTANQQSILGNHFLDWMEEFLNILLSKKGPAFLSGSPGGPAVPTVALTDSILKFQALKNPKFLSHHINLVDNNSVDTWKGPLSKGQLRVDISQVGDTWGSTKADLTNNLVKNDPPIPKPISGNTTDPVVSSGDSLTTVTDKDGEIIQSDTQPTEIIRVENPDIEVILRTMRRKGYQILDRPWEVNIVGIRKRTQGEKYSNSFEDQLYVIYKIDNDTNWQFKKFKISTMPGYYDALEVKKSDGKLSLKPSGYKLRSGEQWGGNTPDGKPIDVKLTSIMKSRGGMGILKEAQYKAIYQIGNFQGAALKARGKQKFYRDDLPGDTIRYNKTGEGSAGMHVHKGFPSGVKVNNWSEGCQVFSSQSEIDEMIKICRVHSERYGNLFNYTLMLERDLS